MSSIAFNSILFFLSVLVGAILSVEWSEKFLNEEVLASTRSSQRFGAQMIQTTSSQLKKEESRWLDSKQQAKNGNEIQEVWRELIKLAQTDPEAALDYAMNQLGGKDEPVDCAEEILNIWSQNNPEEAWTWVRENNNYLIMHVFEGMAKTNPAFALQCVCEYAEENSEHETRPYLAYMNMIEGMMHVGKFEEAAKLLESQEIELTEERWRMAANIMMNFWGAYHPQEAMDWVSSLPDNTSFDKVAALDQLLGVFANEYPEDALNYAYGLAEDDPIREETLFNVAQRVTYTDLEQALEIIEGNHENHLIQKTIETLSTDVRMFQKGHTNAMELAHRIHDNNTRELAHADILGDWLVNDQEAAVDYVLEHRDSFTEESLERAENHAYYSKRRLDKKVPYKRFRIE